MHLPDTNEGKSKFPIIYIVAAAGALIYVFFVMPLLSPVPQSETVEPEEAPVAGKSKDDVLSRYSSQYRPNRNILAPEQFAMDCVNAIEAARNPVTGVLPNVTTCVDHFLPEMPPMPASVMSATVTTHMETNSFIVTVKAADGRTLRWDGAALTEIAE